MRAFNYVCLSILPFVIACSAGDEQAGSAGAPSFLSLGTSVDTLTEGTSVTISAVLNDPDGIDDLIGGSLQSPDGKISYGAFASSAQEGAYSLTISWDDFQAAQSLDFDGETTRTVVAEFFDSDGHAARRELSLRFTCAGPYDQATAGECHGLSACGCFGSGPGCRAEDTCAAFCGAQAMDCVSTCSIGPVEGASVVVFASQTACETDTSPGFPLPGGNSCSAPIDGRWTRCCCSPRG